MTILHQPNASDSGQGLFSASAAGKAKKQVLTLDAPEDIVTVRGTIGDLRKQMAQGIGTLSVVSGKNSTTLNLTLLCEGYADNARFTLRQIGSRTFLTPAGPVRWSRPFRAQLPRASRPRSRSS
mgnify:CR=1 FL=1